MINTSSGFGISAQQSCLSKSLFFSRQTQKQRQLSLKKNISCDSTMERNVPAEVVPRPSFPPAWSGDVFLFANIQVSTGCNYVFPAGSNCPCIAPYQRWLAGAKISHLSTANAVSDVGGTYAPERQCPQF